MSDPLFDMSDPLLDMSDPSYNDGHMIMMSLLVVFLSDGHMIMMSLL